MALTWTDNTLEVYKEASGTIGFNNDDVEYVYIDWGDGEDYTSENAIYQWHKMDTVNNSVTLTHTYTKSGSFGPLVRTINSQGIVSKYYGSSSTNSDVSPYESVGTDIAPITVNDGTPLAVNKIENKTVLSGIDNTIFSEGGKEVFVVVPPLVASSSAIFDNTLKIEVDAVVDNLVNATYDGAPRYDGGDIVLQTYTLDIDLSTQASTTSIALHKLNRDDDPGLNTSRVAQVIKKITGVRFMNPKIPSYVLDGSGATGRFNDKINAWNKMKVFVVASGSGYGRTGSAGGSDMYPITYVSSGDPVKSIRDMKRQVTLDFTQSRSKASNTSIDYYIYDNGKSFFQPQNQWGVSSSTGLSDLTATSGSTLVEGYTYMPRPGGLLNTSTMTTPEGASTPSKALLTTNVWFYGGPGDEAGQSYYIRDQFPLDDFNRFYDQYHLTRAEVNTTSDEFSSIKTFDSVYRITPAYAEGDQTDVSGTVFIDIGAGTGSDEEINGSFTSLVTSGAYYNTSGQTVDMDKWNTTTFYWGPKSYDWDRNASEYLIMTSDEKVNKIFFNVSPYAANMEASTSAANGVTQSTIAGVYYSKVTYEKIGENFTQKFEWEPVPFDNTTMIEKEYRDGDNKTYNTLQYDLAKSGYVSFDTPNDWGTVSISGLAGGIWNETLTWEEEVASPGDTSYLKTFTGDIYSAKDPTGGSPTGGELTYFKLSGSEVTSTFENYTASQIGSKKYYVRLSGSDASARGNTLFVGSGNNSGWFPNELDGSGTLVLQGTIDTPVAEDVSFRMRRVNIYDFFTGVSKSAFISTSDHAGVPWGRDAAFPYKYMLSGGSESTIFNDVTNNLNDKYAIKIVISGASGSFVSGTSHAGLEMLNILPYNNSYSQVVKQVDNSAYDLTMLQLTSNLSINYAGTYYQAVSKSGKVFVVRTGTPIQSLSLSSKVLADDSYADGNDPFNNNNPSGNTWPTYSILKKMRDAQNNNVRVMWDEKQKDGTWVRFFGFITSVQENNQIGGPRMSRTFTADMVVEEICLMDGSGKLISDVIPLGGVKDVKSYI